MTEQTPSPFPEQANESASRHVQASPARTATWIPGMRILNEAELSLGLGSVVRVVDQRMVEIFFGSCQETRIYNVRTAPLRRVRLRPGQNARCHDGLRFRIERVMRTKSGLLAYHGEGRRALETQLADVVPAAEAVDRLLAGQLSFPDDYVLRLDGWRLRGSFLGGQARGLVGARIRPLGHQLFIASTVARREVARVLLADEVGLGKTIEAGLIFSALRALGRAHRVLIVTPSSLVHQWMAEMYRKFNEMFTVLSETRCEELDETQTGGPSPFEATPRAICSLEVLLRSANRRKQATAVEWDLLIVDEAHHLRWTRAADERAGKDGVPAPRSQAEDVSLQAWRVIERLSRRTRGLLLLTATPARDGLPTEYGLLHLVDPERFNDFSRFEQERSRVKEVAEIAQRLACPENSVGEVLTHVTPRLHDLFPQDEGLREALRAGDARAVLAALIDRHGTGRVLIRNRRDRLHGFAQRVLHPVPLQLPEPHPARPQHEETPLDFARISALPEDCRPHDPRVEWLFDLTRSLAGEKIVLICSNERTVHMLARLFREHTALKAAIFHEGLSVVERDRQAAWFAEPDGAVVLLCSEIGGEGRNFQFSHHVVLFDLPLHPDLVEQRIGRLDRIGQNHPVTVHVPYLKETPSEALFRWQNEALGSFERPVSGAEEVLLAMQWQLYQTLRAFQDGAPERGGCHELLEELIGQTRHTLEHVQKTIEKNVDVLVDLNSYDEQAGSALVDIVQATDEDPLLADWMSRVFERFGVGEEPQDEMGRLRIRPTDMMFIDVFPGLPADPMSATYSRTLALAREELDFLTCDHPLVDGALGLMLDSDEGRAAVCAWTDPPARVASPAVLLNCLFILDASGPASLELARYQPITPIELVIDLEGECHDELLQNLRTATLNRTPPEIVARLQPLFTSRIPALLDRAQTEATHRARPLKAEAVKRAQQILGEQQQRLKALRKVNPTLPRSEVEGHAHRMAQTLALLAQAEVHLDALRVILVEP